MQPNETFLQISASDTDIAFVGGIQVYLVDCNGVVVTNIDSNFYYEGFVDDNGISQIVFEFGNIGVDYWTKPLYLKITDLVNDNIYYSNGFLVTNYQSDLTTRFDYTNSTKIYGISYDLAPYTQSVRLSGCYDYTPTNKRDVKQYVTSQGKQVNYRSITTFLRQYNIDSLDYFVNDRLEVLFSHGVIYCNGQRVVVSDYSVDERKGLSNLLNGEFTINPQGQTFTFAYQLYEGFDIVEYFPIGDNTISMIGNNILGSFNKPFSLGTGTIKIYKDGSLFHTINVIDIVLESSVSFSANHTITENGVYYVLIDSGLFYKGSEVYLGVNNPTFWAFNVVDGEFSNTEFNTDEFLTN
jgi:hypothetical protein